MNAEDDLVSTFHPKLFNKEVDNPDKISISKHQQRIGAQINSVLKDPQNYQDPDIMSKMPDSTSRISSIETDISELTNKFRSAFDDLQSKAKQQADKQVQQDRTLVEILNILKSHVTLQTPIIVPTDMSEEANNLQALEAGSPSGTAGNC
jgi:hypothetical protein